LLAYLEEDKMAFASYLRADGGAVKVKLRVGEDIVRINGQRFCIQAVRLLGLGSLKSRISIILLLYQQLGSLHSTTQNTLRGKGPSLI